jgi:peptidoglycan biosynthesis protein MviN/MurJ (putative lipid II flippase)
VGTALALPAMLILDGLRLADLPGLGALDGRLRLGALGLALGASVAAWLERALLGRALSRRLPGHEAPRAETARVAAASLAGAAAGLGTWWWLAGRGLPEAVTAAAALAALGLVFLAAGLASGLPQLRRMRTPKRARR